MQKLSKTWLVDSLTSILDPTQAWCGTIPLKGSGHQKKNTDTSPLTFLMSRPISTLIDTIIQLMVVITMETLIRILMSI